MQILTCFCFVFQKQQGSSDKSFLKFFKWPLFQNGFNDVIHYKLDLEFAPRSPCAKCRKNLSKRLVTIVKSFTHTQTIILFANPKYIKTTTLLTYPIRQMFQHFMLTDFHVDMYQKKINCFGGVIYVN